MKKIVEKILKVLAERYLKRHNPEVIAITGSVGKTTSRKAVLDLISSKFKTNLFSEAGYNTEIGVPLFILEEKAPSVVFFWPVTILKCFIKAFFGKKKAKKVVLEMGADKPGDISYLLSFIKPNISIVTAVAPAHLEAFKSVENILEEKGKVVEILSKEGLAILNYDDIRVRSLINKSKAKTLTYGMSSEADVFASNIKASIDGIKFQLNFKEKHVLVFSKIVGKHTIYALLAAACCGIHYNYTLEEIKKILSNFHPMPGRMNILEGIRGSVLIDDSYNANPTSTSKALEALDSVAPERKIAVLGTMNELGDYFSEAHKKIGEEAAKVSDILVTVGPGGKEIGEEALRRGMDPTSVYIKENALEAGEALRGIIKSKDSVLFKGSQNNVRLEKAVSRVLKYPSQAPELLVRQDKFWQKR